MRSLNANDIKELNLLKHYRIIRKWACKNNDLNDADLELLIYLDCIGLFSIKDFKQCMPCCKNMENEDLQISS